MRMCHPITRLPAIAAWFAVFLTAGAEPLKIRSATASSETPDGPAGRAIDGGLADASRWVGGASAAPSWLELDLGSEHELAGVHLFTGFGRRDPIRDFKIQFRSAGVWRDIPSAVFTNNASTALAIPFDATLDVRTDRLRLWITGSPGNTARVKEILVWPGSAGNVPPLAAGAPPPDIAPIYLNQSGFNHGKPKRFTAPALADGTAFTVRSAKGGAPLFKGAILGHKGDFSAFDPAGGGEYVVEAGGLVSAPFRIGTWWLERVTYQNAVNFMIDARHHTGNVRDPCIGSYGWRDDHHFGWELHTLVAQWISNPSAYERMPRQIRYEKSADPRLWGKLDPYPDDAPDIVKLIHWGADVIVTREATHEMLKSQLAYFLYAWPVLKRWLPEQNHAVVRDFAFRHWASPVADHAYRYDESPEHDLLAVKIRTGTTKGAYPPGFSIQPNLLMYEVAKRGNRPDAPVYLKAASDQAAWIVKNLDWNDPLATKGQRMSEFITVTGLVHLLREYPDASPPGLSSKIDGWAQVAIRRSENLWDFRKLDDAGQWTPMGEKPQMWNEAGNVAGFPAPLLAAREVIKDASVRNRLEQLAWSHFDNMFGRNPTGRHFSYDAPREIEGVEHGWFSFYPGGIGRLADARFVIDGSPKNAHYPWHPEKGNIGWTEGWVQFNTAFNASLAYLAWSDTTIELARDRGGLCVRLRAPLNFDESIVENGRVLIESANGDTETLMITEESADPRFLSGSLPVRPSSAARPGDGVLQHPAGTTVRASYGFGYLGRRATLNL